MRAEHLPKLLVAALADEEEIDLAKRRRKAIGVVMLVLDPVAPRGQDAVVHRRGGVGAQAGPDPVGLVREIDDDVVLEAHAHRGGERAHRANAQTFRLEVLPEEVMGLLMATVRQRPAGSGQRTVGGGAHGDSSLALPVAGSRRSMAAIGMVTQVGRLLAS